MQINFYKLSLKYGTSIRHIESAQVQVDEQMMLETAIKIFAQ